MNRIKTIFLALCLILSSLSEMKGRENGGKWNLYLSYNQISEIEPMGSKTFVLASNGLFSYRVQDGDLVTYSKVNVLSDASINHIAWSKSAQQLVITYINGNIDLLSEKGDVINIPDFYLKSLSDSKTINHICIQGSEAYLSTSFGVIKLDVAQATIQDTYRLDFNVDYSYLKEGYVYAASSQRGIYRGALTDNLLDKSNWKRVSDYVYPSEDHKNVYDATNKYWWTTTANGKLTYYTVDAEGNRSYKTEGILPEGPASNNFYRLYAHDGNIYATGGFYNQEKDGNYPGEVHVWDGISWTEFEQPTAEVLGHNNVDWLSMAFDPLKEDHVMVAAKSGLYEFQNGKFVKCYDMSNSPLTSCVNSNDYMLMSDLMYDKEGTLWLFNSSVNKSFWTIDKNNTWKSLDISSQIRYNDDLRCPFISSTNGKMWFLSNYWQSTQLYAYDYINDKLTSYGPSYTNEDGISVTPTYFYQMAEDREGNIWMCTASGPFYLSAANIAAGNAEFTQHKVARNDGTNYADYLLADVWTRCIAIDGGNRKWVGTNSDGLYVISSDNNTQVAHFTTDNSPLLSNTILDILIDQNSGKVYIATPEGLCSYMSSVTEPADEMDKDNVYAYPNPVTPDYTGSINIVGLSYDADVKIVTSNGTLVNQGRSIGGSYAWDGCDTKGRKVASGIYMVETATSDGQKGVVCKIAIVH